jgi:hypothetical protein
MTPGSIEIAARQDLAVRLHRKGIDTIHRIRFERIGQASRGIEPGDVSALLTANAVEKAARQDLAVRLIARERIPPLVFGLNESARPVVASIWARAMRFSPPM